jgi:YHS domain-containing protein
MILRLVLTGIVIYFLCRMVKGILSANQPRETLSSGDNQSHHSQRTGEDLVEDPVCRTYIPVSNSLVLENNGRKLFFCSRECLEKYRSSL